MPDAYTYFQMILVWCRSDKGLAGVTIVFGGRCCPSMGMQDTVNVRLTVEHRTIVKLVDISTSL